jgi:hypothetical protein
MTRVIVVCTGRNTHPETAAEPANFPADPLPAPPPPPTAEAIEELRTRPRRKDRSAAIEYACPECGQRRRLGVRRLGRLLRADDAVNDAASALYGERAPAFVPVDLSFM